MYRRTRGRRRRFEDGLLTQASTGAIGTNSPDPAESVLAAEKNERVQTALAALNELDRQILMLKYAEGWTYRQLSEHLGVKEDTVEYRLMKARKNLRRLLAGFVAEV